MLRNIPPFVFALGLNLSASLAITFGVGGTLLAGIINSGWDTVITMPLLAMWFMNGTRS